MNWLSVAVRPALWIRNYRTSRSLTEFVNSKLDEGELPVITSDCTMTIGGVMVWRANWPCAYGQVWGNGLEFSLLPSRMAALRLREAELLVVGSQEDRLRRAIYGGEDDE